MVLLIFKEIDKRIPGKIGILDQPPLIKFKDKKIEGSIRL